MFMNIKSSLYNRADAIANVLTGLNVIPKIAIMATMALSS